MSKREENAIGSEAAASPIAACKRILKIEGGIVKTPFARLVRDFYEIGYQFASQQHQDGWIKSDMGADHHFSSFRIRLHTKL